MIIILNISGEKFSFNGIPYFKNFMPHVLAGKLKIVNVFDSDFELTELQPPTNYSLDGVIYSSVSELQNALLPVLYTRNSLNFNSDLPFYNQITKQNGITSSGLNKNFVAGWEWLINDVKYSNVTDQTISFPLASSGKQRLDRIVVTNLNTFIRIPGLESFSSPSAEARPDNTVDVTFVLVTDSEVGEPSTPVIGPADLALKLDKATYNGNAQDLKNDIDQNTAEINLKLNISDYNEYFQGKFTSLANLQAAMPTAKDGDYAIVDVGAGVNAKEYIWDNEEGWILSGSVGPSTTDALPEGSIHLYFQTARVLATTLSGLSYLIGGSIVSTDTVLGAFGKLQKQISDILVSLGLKQDILVSGTNIKTVNFGNLLGNGNLPIQFMNATTFEGYGDSITVGQNSSPTSNSYINLTAGLYSKVVTNRAVSGRGIWESTKQHFANITTSSTVLAIVMAGFNDVRRGGSATKTKNKILNGYKSILVNHFLNSFIAAGTTSASITRSGTWTNTYSGIAVGAKTNTGSYSNINGNYIEYTFTDNNIVVGLVAGDGVTQIHADFTVLIDGVSQGSFSENGQTDGISDGNNDNARSAMCLIFSGLSEGTHTIRLTNTTSNYLIVDYFGHLKQPKFCYPVLIMQAPKMDATGYATVPNLANDTVINQLNTDLIAMVSSFPADYPIVIGDTNSYYNIATGLDTADHIHPNNIGHRQIFKAAYLALKPLLLGGSNPADATTTTKGIIKLAGDLGGTADLPTVPSLTNKLNINANVSLAGTGTRMMEATSDGTPIATYVKYQMKVSDSDVITAITGATYTSGVATITPASSKVMMEGQVYQSGSYLYRAYSDNVVLRTAIV